jgi:hypothetical protein
MHGIRNSKNGRVAVLGFTVEGQLALPSRSFWRSLMAQFPETVRFPAPADQQALDEAEFFHRLRVLQPQAEVRYELDWDDEGNAILLAPRSTASEFDQVEHQPLTQPTQPGGSRDTYFMSNSPGTLRFSVN